MKKSKSIISERNLNKQSLILAIAAIVSMAFYVVLGLLWPEYKFYGIDLRDIPLVFVSIIGGLPLGLQVVRKILKGDLGADSLAVIALITAIVLKEYLAATLIILMMAGGQALEEMAARKASAVLTALASRMPSIAHRKAEDVITDIKISEIACDDLIVVFPHETCPVDGTVFEGHGSMNEAYLTGEPYQVSKAPGATVLSGAINGEAALTIKTEALPKDSRYAQIMKVMEDAEQKRPNLRRLGDQIGAIFAPVALLCAGLVWYFTGDATRFLSVLVIATPCPLLIAIPITLISAISIAARRGIIIKDPTVLERLPTCRTAIFDKTGTLTYGQPELVEIIVAKGMDSDTVLQQVASLERYSKHPLATAILNAAKQSPLSLLQADKVSEKPGKGLFGIVNKSSILVTHRKSIAKEFPEMLSMLPPVYSGLEFSVLINDKYAATFHLRDKPRSEGKRFISHLAPLHHFSKIMIVSGGRESEVTYLANIMGIKETYASQSPEQKLAIVRAQTKKSPTIYMGDGINDAPALAAATVGIAFGGVSSITSEAAGAVILDNTLEKVDELLHISIAMRKIALQSAIGGMVLSFVGMGFAASGHLSPVVGALLQEVIDGIAILNALRLIWQTGKMGDMK